MYRNFERAVENGSAFKVLAVAQNFSHDYTQTLIFKKHFHVTSSPLQKKNASMGKGTVHRSAKRAKIISRQNVKRINKNYFTMLSLWTSLCITSWHIYITTAATQKKSVKGYSFWNVDSVTFLATTVAWLCRMLTCGTFTCFSTWYLSASLSLLMCALGNVFFLLFTKLVLEWAQHDRQLRQLWQLAKNETQTNQYAKQGNSKKSKYLSDSIAYEDPTTTKLHCQCHSCTCSKAYQVFKPEWCTFQCCHFKT